MVLQNPRPASPGWAHRLAFITCGISLILIYAGGLVTSLGAGLSVPDWPSTFGYNMFLFPWAKMVGGIFYEHSHRLLGSLAGIFTILTAASIWMNEPRKWVRWMAAAALGLVVLQGLLGGLRVVLLKIDLAIVHACLAQLFFGLMVSIALVTSPSWHQPASDMTPEEGQDFRRLARMVVIFIYIQIVFGAILRHTGARLDAHLLFAVLASILCIRLSMKVLRHPGSGEDLTHPAHALWIFLALQLALGAGSYLVKYTSMGDDLYRGGIVIVTSAHVVIGSLLFASALILALRLYRAAEGEWALPRGSYTAGGVPA
ncbi:MAG: COX15/CtaA family protein [bacterium]|nr:COX15/CtaA family protein [bacterium]